MKHLLSSITLLLLSTLAFGSDNNSENLTVPHTFNSGETISSSKMNENFQALITMIKDSKKYIYSDNEKVAEFLSYDKDGRIVGITSKDFKFRLENVHLFTSDLASIITFSHDILFVSTNCSGQGYILTSQAEKHVGHVFALAGADWPNFNLYYIEEDSQKEVLDTGSAIGYGSSNCIVLNQVQQSLVKITPNQESHTGLSEIFYNKPITIN